MRYIICLQTVFFYMSVHRPAGPFLLFALIMILLTAKWLVLLYLSIDNENRKNLSL